MIIISTILFVPVISLMTWVVFEQWSANRNMKTLLQNLMNNQLYNEEPQPFSLSAYFDRIETIQIELLQEREQNPVSKVIELWWGLEGVKLLEDGTTEWVRKDAAQMLREKTAPRDRECELEYRRWYQMANANNTMFKLATAILDKYRKLDMQNARAKSLFNCYIELEEAIGMFNKIHCLDEQREAEELLERCDRTINNREWEVEMNMRQAMMPPLFQSDYIANPSILDYTGGLYGINGIENANHKHSAELSNATTLYETVIQAQANQYFPQQFCQQSCGLESQINQSIAQQTQAIESDIRTLRIQISQQEQTMIPNTNAYKGVPAFLSVLDEIYNCCATKSSKK